MRVCGVICEYDPFHNGHAHHLRRVRELSGCEYIVCAMSGYFTQRGEAALVSKWARAEMALRCGADAVFELPTLFALRDAQRFALGGVALLDGLGVVTHLGFGSESADADALRRQALATPDPDALRAGLACGKAHARALGEATGQDAGKPNDTLAVEYLRAMRLLGAAWETVAVPRAGGGHHDGALSAMASASAVRRALRQGEDVSRAMPEAAWSLLVRQWEEGACQRADGLDGALLACLRRMDAAEMAQAADIGEGLEHRFARAAWTASGREALLDRVKCKRYTRARLSRIASQLLLGLTRSLALSHPLPDYARLLGFRREARPLLAAISERSRLPLVLRPAKFRIQHNAAFALDLRAAALWPLGCGAPQLRAGDRELTQKVIILDETTISD